MKEVLKKVWIVLAVSCIVLMNAMEVSAKELIIGFDDTFAPFGFKTDLLDNYEGDEEFTGLDVELAREVFSRMKVDYRFQTIDWAMKETELETGQIDAIWNGYAITPEREEKLALSIPYMSSKQMIVVKADSDIQTKEDLDGKVIATQAESSSYDALMQDDTLPNIIDGGAPVTYSTFMEVFSDLDTNRADGIVVANTMILYYLAQTGKTKEYRLLDEDLAREDVAVGFRKDEQEFVDEFNKTLQEVLDDGTFDKIYEKWFGVQNND
ncbi:amino acid ABC transporter substrate-binding protein [Dolosicoccus paucivorans]|uniref:amino acid ABC transporter substrate-binding protein n=1 Tax=Dolosicoccus paucivorans TaxID=84521 RepID=UPI00088ADFBE|nr:amino acid ABC transporter substrate-binding protein [Dolosicoccus paucivorans]SDI42782.1 polar amino acid transport system substrate-binding protein [Dolosicoccus paucivorans]